MRKSKVQRTIAVLMAAMLLGGCGEAPYDLTEKEQNVIVNYSAHVVAKYNTAQKEGLTYVDPELETETEAVVPAAEETQETVPEGSEPAAEGAASDAVDRLASAAASATLDELFGTESVKVDYVGARLSSNYAESAYYAMEPDEGKIYLVIGIDITNEGATPVQIDYLTRTPKFQAAVNDQAISSAEFTILSEDFSVFQGILAAGETKETVLVFQVPDTIEAIEKLDFFVELDGNNYQIIV